MLKYPFIRIATALTLALLTYASQAQVSQTPLIAKSEGVIPNIVFMFDDSGSMPMPALYQYGGSAGGYGMTGPNDDVTTVPLPSKFHSRSPDVNLIYYDPRVTYSQRIYADGSYQGQGSSPNSSFNVYFYKPGTSSIYSVKTGVAGVTINNGGSGYPSSGVTGTFSVPPAGGTRATATVTTAAVSTVASATVTTTGTGYPTSGTSVIFSAPPAGGVTATGSINTTNSNNATAVVVNNGGSGYPSTGVTATFSAPSAGGTNATGTPVITARNTVGSVTVTAHGTGYPASGKTITFSSAPAGGVTATGTVNTATFYTVAGTTKGSGGLGYTAAPTVTFSAPPSGGTTATGTATITYDRGVTAVAIGSAGSGYTSTPSVAFSGGGGSGAAATPVVTFKYPLANLTLGSGGTGYTSNPTVTFTGGGGSGAAASVTRTGTVTGFTRNSRGSNYTSVPTVTLTGGGGTGATAVAVLDIANKRISAVNVINPGTGYTSAPTVTITGGGGSGASFSAAISSSVSTITLTSAGSGYTSAPTVTISGGGGAGATATVGLGSSATGGTVTGITLTSGGSGYTGTPTITFSGGGGSGATATPTLGNIAGTGTVSSISITSAGSGYKTAPNIAFTGGGGGSGASFTANLSATGVVGIDSITINNPGSGYTTTPTYSLGGTAGGSGAAMTVVTGTSNVITGITVTNGGSGYVTPPSITITAATGSGATFTTSLGTTRVIGSITMTNNGSGYTSVPTCTISSSSGTGAACTAVLGTTYKVFSVDVTNGGSGYLSVPTLTIGTTTGSGASFTVNTNSTSVAGVNKKWDGVGTPTTVTSYFSTGSPAGYTPDAGSPLAPGASVLPYPNVASSATSTYPKFAKRTDCAPAATSCTWAEEKKNYDNWYTYHRTRLDIAKTGVGLAFQPLGGTFRLGWATINDDLEAASQVAAGVRPFDLTTSTAFLSWLYARTATGNTPNRVALNKVGQYYQRKDNNGPWGDDPPIGSTSTSPSTGTANTSHATCRRSYAVLMTDGYYNDTFTLTDVDSIAKTVPGYTYNPEGPYSDTKIGTRFDNSFADIAMNYWLNDLRPDLNNDLKSKVNDPALWQHLNFYAIGLGIVGTLDATNPQTKAALTGTASRTLDWPTPTANSAKAIDDMWHATINGRGLLLNARTAEELRDSIRQIISDVSGKEDSQSGVAVSTVSLSSDTMKYTPWYTPGYWIGDVRGWHLNKETAAQIEPPAWEIETLTGTDPLTGVPSYTSLIPAYDRRNIVVGNGATSGTRAEAFDFSTLSASLKSAMNGTVNANLINYLKGDPSNEDVLGNENAATAIYRGRVARLGDIVNSTPSFVYQTTAIDYSSVPSTGGSFAAYRSSKAARAEGMLFVGANDGMLHGFRNGQYTYDANGNVTSVPQSGGIETFAYIPRAILPTINQLADKSYTHRYYVDGPVVEADAHINGAWANVIIGSTGAGAGSANTSGVSPGTSVFAIDVTSLHSDVSSLNASTVLWEVGSQLPTAGSSQFSELGYMVSDVQTGPTLDGNWVAIFGNGVDSASCKAQLFVVNLANGALLKRLDTGKGNCSPTTDKNGLSGVRLVRNDKKQIIGVYAGDLQGNMWKFSLNDASTSNWKVDLGGDPLFSAGATQPITAPPTVIDLADANVWADGKNTAPKPGYMVVFGTGKLLTTGDLTNTAQQTLYGVWDNLAVGAVSSATGSAKVAASSLVAQSVGATTTTVNGADYFSSSKNTVDYSLGKKGWSLNFPNSGQRMVYPMETLAYHYVGVDTISPAGVSLNSCVSGSGGAGYFYVLEALSGAAPTENVVGIPDVNGVRTSLDGRNVALQVDDAAQFIYKILTPESDPVATVAINKPTPAGGGAKIRKWRQLFMR